MKKMSKTPLAAAVGTALVTSFTASTAQAEANPFTMSELANGYMQVAESDSGYTVKPFPKKSSKAKEASCGEGQCGAMMENGKMKKGMENSCGAMMKGKEGACGEMGATKTMETEGKCGEGKCGDMMENGKMKKGMESSCGAMMKGKEGACGMGMGGMMKGKAMPEGMSNDMMKGEGMKGGEMSCGAMMKGGEMTCGAKIDPEKAAGE